MLGEITKLKEQLRELKQKQIEKLRASNSNIDINTLMKKYIYFNPSSSDTAAIKIAKVSNGFYIKSILEEDKHEYIKLENPNQTKDIIQIINNLTKPFIEMSFKGSIIGEMDVELHVVTITKDQQHDSQKLKVGQTKQLSLPKEIEKISFLIRVKGTGYINVSSPLLIIGEQNQIAFELQAKKIKDMQVIFIADEFTTKCFRDEFEIIPISPQRWERELGNKTPDLFFCESAWLGNNGKWKDKIGTGGPRDNTLLLEVIKYCRTRNIPTVFWNKEDPFHYNAFINTAKHFDYVFTTDERSVQTYKDDGCENVFTLPFAAQPKLHNPIEKYERKNKVVFAGAYYGEKFAERKKAMDNMINVSGEFGLEIYDRNLNNPESPNQFPEEFKKYIVGTLPSEQIDRAYKGYKVSLNVNSIIDSPTMFSRRVFEILASNTPVVSSESLGMTNFFGDIMTISSDFDVLKEGISKYFMDEEFYRQNRLMSLRRVFEEHTYHHRVLKVLNSINYPYINEEKRTSYVAIIRSYEDYEYVLNLFNKQNLKNKHLVLLLDLFEGYLDIFNNNNNKEVTSYLLDYIHNYPEMSKIFKSEYIIPLSKDHLYGDNYGRDLFIATQYANNSVIVKNSSQEYVYTNEGNIDQALLPVEVLSFLSPVDFVDMLVSKKSMGNWFKFGVSFFNIDHYNFIANYKQVPQIEEQKKLLFI